MERHRKTDRGQGQGCSVEGAGLAQVHCEDVLERARRRLGRALRAGHDAVGYSDRPYEGVFGGDCGAAASHVRGWRTAHWLSWGGF
jgi:hypothetical protein